MIEKPSLIHSDDQVEIRELREKLALFENRKSQISREIANAQAGFDAEYVQRTAASTKSVDEYIASLGKIVPDLRDKYADLQDRVRKLYGERKIVEAAIEKIKKSLNEANARLGKEQQQKARPYYEQLASELGRALMAVVDIHDELEQFHHEYDNLGYFLPWHYNAPLRWLDDARQPIGDRENGSVLAMIQRLIDADLFDVNEAKEAGFVVRRKSQ